MRTGAFDLATALLFNNVDPQRAVKLWKQLAQHKQCVDAHVALGIALIEGLGVDADARAVSARVFCAAPARRHAAALYFGDTRCADIIAGQQGLAHLQTACQHASAQGYYEMGSALYSGLPGVLAEDEKEAFRMFARAAEQQHSAGTCWLAAVVHGPRAWIEGDRPPAYAHEH